MSIATCINCGHPIAIDDDPAACIEDRFICEACRKALGIAELEDRAERDNQAAIRLGETLRGDRG